MTAEYDFVVIGGGINGLSAAAYLGRRGFSTILLERGGELGGCAITRELTLPGFKHDVFATSLNLFKAGPLREDLELDRYGFREALPDPVTAHPFPAGEAIYMYRDHEKTLRSIERFSRRDAKSFAELYSMYRASRDVLLGGLFSPPLPLSTMASLLEESEEGLEFLRLSFLSIRDFLDERFESEEVKAWLAVWGSNHVPYSPEDAGSTLFLIVFMGILQEFGCGVPIGGIKSLIDAIARYVVDHRGEVRVNAPVKRIEVRNERAEGVVLESGERVKARYGVLATVEPKTLFLKMIGEDHLDSSFIKKVRNFKFSNVSQVMIHAALDAWLDYRPSDVSRAGIVQVGPTLESVSRSYNQCVNGHLPDEPFMTIDNVTCYDDSRAPGKHVLWCFVRSPARLKAGRWVDVKEEFADRCLDVLTQYAPNAKSIILKRVVLAPDDQEGINPNIVNADPGVGKATLDQSMSLRPFAGWSSYRTPIKGLYMCGSYTHPGGGVSGASGYNAVRIVLEDIEKGELKKLE